jgi:hypothetical protein
VGAGHGSSAHSAFAVWPVYLRGERWAYRICCGLAYRSELELKGYRGQMMARKIQARLGGDRSGFEFHGARATLAAPIYRRALSARGEPKGLRGRRADQVRHPRVPAY